MWVLESLNSVSSCVTLGNLLSLSFFICKVGIVILAHSTLVTIKLVYIQLLKALRGQLTTNTNNILRKHSNQNIVK